MVNIDEETWLFLDALQLIEKIIEFGGVINWVMWENAPYFISGKQDAIITDRLGEKKYYSILVLCLDNMIFTSMLKFLMLAFMVRLRPEKEVSSCADEVRCGISLFLMTSN